MWFNFKPLARKVAEISAGRSFPIEKVCWGPTIGFQSEPTVHNHSKTSHHEPLRGQQLRKRGECEGCTGQGGGGQYEGRGWRDSSDGNNGVIELLLEQPGLDLGVTDRGSGGTALHWACSYDRVKIVGRLLDVVGE